MRLAGRLLVRRSLDSKLKMVTDGVVDIFGADFARVWIVKPGDICEKGCIHAGVTKDACRNRRQCLHLISSSGRYSRIDGAHHRVPMGCYKIGRVASGEDVSFVTNEVAHDPRVHDHRWAEGLGLVSFAGYRLLSSDGLPIGVLALFKKTAIGPEEETFLQNLVITTSYVIAEGMADQALQDKNDELDSFFSLSLNLLCVADTDGHFRRLNPEWEKTLGYPLQELEGRRYLDFVHPDDREATMETASRLSRQEEVINFKNRYRRADGSYVWLEWSSHPRGKLVYAVAGDITDRKRAEKALLKSEERYRRISQTITDYIYAVRIKDGEHLETSHGPGCLGVTGYSEQEFAEDQYLWITMVFPEDKALVEDLSRRILTEGHSNPIEHRIFRKDGALRWVRNTPVLHYDEGGALIGYDGLIQDITEAKKSEEILQKSRSDLMAILDNLPFLAWLKDSEGRFIAVNGPFARACGCASPDEVMGKTDFDVWPRQLAEGYRSDDAAVMLSGKKKAVEEVISDKGINKWFETYKSPLFDVHGNVTGTTGFARDITERKQAEEALRVSEERYRLVVENANDAIFIVQDDKIKFPNRQTMVLTAWPEDELKNLPFSDLVHPDDREIVREMHRQSLRGEDLPTTCSFRIITKSGETGWIEASVVLVAWDGNPAVLCLLRDVTVQKRLEEQLFHAQKMEAIGTLAGGIAHDFNNLLMSILGYTSLMLLKTDKTHPFYEKLKIIERQVESGSELTRQLLGFARGGKYEVKPVNVNDLIAKTSEIFGRTKKEITIHRQLQRDLSSIEADRGQIEQVLFNLYVNAWQAMPDGGGLYIKTKNVSLDEKYCIPYDAPSGDYVKIDITDTGVGMDAETQKRVFEPFFSTKGFGKGSGLGLASVYGIMKNHQGFVNVYSEPGHGSTFSLYLPVSEEEARESKSAGGTLLTGDETILVVDDEEANTLAVRELLEMLGYKVETARSGREAIELYKSLRDKIDLLILDMIMPGMNGREAFVKLKEMDSDVKVLLSSGYSINGEAQNILELGCRGFLQKPFRIEELARKVRDAINGTNS